MSDAIETTAAGATRVLFGTVAFICLMVGIEGMTGVEKISIGLSGLLIGAGAICAYAAFFWEKAKKVLSDEAQGAIARFSRSGTTKAALLLAVLVSISLSPFIEQHRWPFSYPADPKVEADNVALRNEVDKLNSAAGREKESADKWRFISELWSSSQTNAGPPECEYQIKYPGRSANVVLTFWRSLLQGAGWKGMSFVQDDEAALQPGITIRSSGDANTLDRSSSPQPTFQCASALQKALSDFYPNPPAKLITIQTTPFLDGCTRVCVEVDVDY